MSRASHATVLLAAPVFLRAPVALTFTLARQFISRVPAGASPCSTYRHNAISSLRAREIAKAKRGSAIASCGVSVLWAGGVPAAQAADLKIEAGAQGAKVQVAGLQGSATRLSYDDAKGILVLEGTADTPATLVRSRMGQSEVIRAGKIIYSLKDGTFTVSATLP